MSEAKAPQSKVAMILICLFLGGLGIHRAMMGHSNWWLMLLLTFVCGLGYIWAFIDLILIATGSLKMADGRELT